MVRFGEEPMEFEPGALQIRRDLCAVNRAGGRRHMEDPSPH
jgi:hypothetical protein